ncbi:UNVERIFIED_CONTAM: hypothetical protein LK11_34885 [Mumia flava]|uniref:PfkB family carbohydrate kinase n=1 Tax=Mumia flava TaxID=1348852 RepID=UPI000573198F|nr:PfkB family carbohydrate kinase [Mumia flava]
MSDRRGRVVVVGSLNVDLVTSVARHPGPGETILGSDLTRSHGGKGANQALAAARAGAQVAFVGRLGDDSDGAQYRTALRAAGIDDQHLRTTAGVPTGTALIVVDGAGENTIVVAPGANARLSAEDVRAAADVLADADVVLVQLEVGDEAVSAAFALAAEHGVRVVLNPSPVRTVPRAWLEAADPTVVNEHEQRAYDLAEACVTLGGRGATWHGTTVAPPATEVVDTTGAGDAFAGALAAALARGDDDATALRAAVAAGAEATTWVGAQPD